MEYPVSTETHKMIQKLKDDRQKQMEFQTAEGVNADETADAGTEYARLNGDGTESAGQAAAAGDPASIRQKRLSPLYENFPFFAGLSLLFGVGFTFCLYRNPCGITYPVFTALACLCGVLACKKLEVPIKRGSWFLIAVALLLGISTCRTGDWFLITMNGVALVLLGSVFAIHQFYEDSAWNIGKYFGSVLLYLTHAIGILQWPFQHLSQYAKKQEKGAWKRFSLFLTGFAIAVPVLAVVTALLAQADPVFDDFMFRFMFRFLNPINVFHAVVQTVFGTLAFYCLAGSCCLHNLKEEVTDKRRGEPLIAAVCMGTVGIVYLIFCSIQIIYLFLGKGTLPEGYTYSSYARQGFFQLLAVALLNLVMVLCCLKYIRPHRVLQVLLTVICGCTYIMIVSAFYRMTLYVREYHLSYLRVLVLWFLTLLSVLMAGVTCMVWKERFPLFRFGLAVVSVFYVGLAFSRPEAIIARDYVKWLTPQTVTEEDLIYLTEWLGTDAAPAIASLDLTEEDLQRASEYIRWNDYFQNYLNEQTGLETHQMGIRRFNFSYEEARRLFPGE